MEKISSTLQYCFSEQYENLSNSSDEFKTAYENFNGRVYSPNNRTTRKWTIWNKFKPKQWNQSQSLSTSTTSTSLESQHVPRTTGYYSENLESQLKLLDSNNMKKETEHNPSINNDPETNEVCQNSSSTKMKPKIYLLKQVIAALAVSWVSMIIGYSSAYTSPAIPSLKKDLEITADEIKWICGLMPLLALAGGLLGGPLIEYVGRKWTLLITDILFLVAWAVNYFATHYWYMYVSRMIAGCGVGIASLTLPVYLGETVQPEVRGTLGLLPTAFGNIGILLCFLLGNVLGWQGLAGVGALLPFPFLIIIWIIPETPRWYISKDKDEECKKALTWLRGANNEDAIIKEYSDLRQTQKEANEKTDLTSLIMSKTNIKSLFIVLGLMFFQQLSGINAIIFYTTQIFHDTGSQLKPEICTTIIGIVNFISTFIATILIDKLGRKVLLYISSVAMIITTGILGTYFYLHNVAQIDIASYGWLPLASFVIYILGFSLGFGPVPWLMMGEILPAKIRGPAASIATGFNWTCTFIVTTTFPLFKNYIGPEGVFWMFGAFCIVGLVFTVLFVPETRGQSLEDIERKLAGERLRRKSSVANLKPMPSSLA